MRFMTVGRRCRVVSLLVVLAGAGLTSGALADETPPTSTSYTVKAGDTCAAIAKRTYGDARYVDLIHTANPNMGSPPHALKPGTVLILPPKPGAAPAGPDARVTWLRNQVEVRNPDPHPAKKDDPLLRGNRVGTKASSAADVTFRDETQLKLSENTLIVILGDEQARAARVAGSETTLVTGSLRSRLAELSGKRHDVATTTGAVATLGAGEAQVSVDEKNTTRLSVYKGQSELTAEKKTVKVPDGFGSKAPNGVSPTPPRPLPEPPVFQVADKRVLVTEAGSSFTLAFAFAAPPPSAGSSPSPAATAWHVQLARDPDFREIVADAVVPRSVDKIETKNASSGTYYARASAIDDDRFEGKWSALSHAAVVEVRAKSLPGRRSELSFLPKEARCVVAGGSGLVLDRSKRPPTVTCTTPTTDEVVGAITLPKLPLETVKAVAWVVMDSARQGTLHVRLSGAANEPVTGVSIQPTSLPPGVSLVGPIHPLAPESSEYVATISYAADAITGPIGLRVIDGLSISTADAKTNVVPPPPKTEQPTIALGVGGRLVAIRATQAGAMGLALDGGASRPLGRGRLLVDLGGTVDRVLVAKGETTEGRDIARARGNIWGGHIYAGYRLGGSNNLLAPYGWLGPEITYLDTRIRQSGARVDGTATALGVAGGFGVELRTSPRSAVFAEIGGRLSAAIDVQGTTYNATAAAFTLGHRFFVWPGLR